MGRNTTILFVGALVAVLAIGGLAPVVSAHGGTDTDQPAPSPDAENSTDAHAEYMAKWMATRMGPEGVEAFEEETGTTVEAVAHAMVEQMQPQAGTWNPTRDSGQFGPGSSFGYQALGGTYGPQMPFGNGYGPGMWGGVGPDMGFNSGGAYGPSGGYGPSDGGYGSGGHGHGMGGHMGGGW